MQSIEIGETRYIICYTYSRERAEKNSDVIIKKFSHGDYTVLKHKDGAYLVCKKMINTEFSEVNNNNQEDDKMLE